MWLGRARLAACRQCGEAGRFLVAAVKWSVQHAPASKHLLLYVAHAVHVVCARVGTETLLPPPAWSEFGACMPHAPSAA